MTETIQADIAIVGAGPAGMMAAIAAASAPSRPRVVILEQMGKPGLKLLATGGGHCNLTNTLETTPFIERFGKKGRFMRPALAALDAQGLRSFFAECGAPTHSPDGFHVFPESESAAAIQRALLQSLEEESVRLLTGAKVKKFHIRDGELQGVVLESGMVETRRAILATGGRSYDALGASGSGYRLARLAGHAIVEPIPALTPLLTKEEWPMRCAGIALRGVRARIDLKGASKAGCVGDLLFTHRGISGPVVLDISGDVAALLAGGDPVPLRLELANESRSTDGWQEVLGKWQRSSGAMNLQKLLARHVPVALAREFCAIAGLGEKTPAAHLPAGARRTLADLLAQTPVTISGTEGFGKAMVTRGGVSLKKVTPQSLQSRLVAGLFFAGEVLDLDGPCGGYNLQWAFSSGYLAGLSAAESLTDPN